MEVTHVAHNDCLTFDQEGLEVLMVKREAVSECDMGHLHWRSAFFFRLAKGP